MDRISLVAGLLILTVCVLADSAQAQRTLNHGIHAVPAPDRVTIDGDLSEWDRSGEIICCKNVEALLDIESGRVAAMWDEENLYVGVAWRDTRPMQNKVDPATMAGNGWRSDCLQLRCRMDGFIAHIDCWYYTPEKKSAMSVAYKDLGVRDAKSHGGDRPGDPTKLGAEQAFRLGADGASYTQEIKIPWPVITKDRRRPRGGLLQLGVELFWGDVAADSWPESRMTDNVMDGETQVDFFWSNSKAWGKLLLEEENDLTLPAPKWMKAKRVEPRGAVPVTFSIPRDSYVTIAIEDEAGSRVKSLVGGVQFEGGENTAWWSGLDDRNRPLKPGTYRWKGLYRDRIDLNWLLSFYQPNAVSPWQNVDGTGAWGPDHGNIQAVAAGGGRVFLGGLGAEAGIPVFGISEDGRKVWSAKSGEPDRIAYVDGIVYGHTSRGDSNWLGITARGMMRFEAETGRWLDIPGRDGKPTKRLALLKEGEAAAGLAADTGSLYLSVADSGQIAAFDRTTFEESRRYSVPGAGELCSRGDERVLVCTPRAVVELNAATGSTKTLFEGDLASARAITSDASDSVYVALGAPHHQVQVLKRAGDKLVVSKTIGRAGGRTLDGKYDPNEGFREPCDLAVDSRGRLWVVEHSQHPKRTSVWKNGSWARDFIGDTGYGGGGIINPLDPTEAFYRDMTFEIDLDAGTWKLTHVGFVSPRGGEKLGLTSNAGDHATGGDVDAEYAMAYGDRAYIHKCRGARHIYRKRADGRWALCAFVDPKKKLAWMDRNDDCVVQDAEIVRGGADDDWGGTDYWGMRPNENLDLYFSRGLDRPGLRLCRTGMTKGGTPLYDFACFEEMAGECMNGVGMADGTYNSGCAGERGEYFSEMRQIHGAGVAHKTFWFRGEKTGRWTARMPKPGVVLYPFQAHGIARMPGVGELVCWVSDFGQRYLFTDDMLYVDELFTDGRTSRTTWPGTPERGFTANAMSPGQESFHGFFTRLSDGRFVLTTGFTDCRVFDMAGMYSIERMEGEVEIKAEHLASAERIRAFRLGGGKARGKVEIVRAKRAPRVDGSATEWRAAPDARIDVDDNRSALVRTSYDDENLYVSWQVKGVERFVNSSQDWRVAFKGGNAVDVMYRAPGAKLDDAAPRAGDVRVLIARISGEVRAVVYRPVSAEKHPYTFDAFEGAGRANAVRMDDVRLAKEVRAAVRESAGGYVVEAAMPWTVLGGAATTGAEARIDFGVLFGDAAGAQTMVRAYWENADTNIVSDIPSEAALKPGNWGVALFGK